MKINVILMVLVGLFFYTLVDILIWQRIFEAKDLVATGVGVYHLGYVMVLIGLIAVGAIALLPNIHLAILYSISLAVLAFSGWEDILYYWLDGKSLPAFLPWLSHNPLIFSDPVTATGLLLSAIFWLVLVALFIYFF